MADSPHSDDNDMEKSHIGDHVEKTMTEVSNDRHISEFTPAQQRKIIHRIDRRLVLTLGAMYCVSLMDRTNLGNAAIAGMTTDLKMLHTDRYSLVSLIFFIPYVLFQPPATVLLRKIGPRKFLSAITLFWGAVMIGFGFVHDWTAMMGLRVILGVLEAGFFPGCAYLLSTWYTRFDLQKRNAVFYLIGSMASAFSGILAYGFMQMAGLGGLAGWKWIFIVSNPLTLLGVNSPQLKKIQWEGIITCLLGIAGYFLIVDFPEQSKNSWKFINEAEAAYVVARIEKDRHDAIPDKFRIGAYFKNALDMKVWGFAALFGLSTTTSYAIAYFLPIILRGGLGFSIAKAQCLVAPPYVAAAIIMYAEAVMADRLHLRGPFVVINAIFGLIGLPLLGYAKNDSVRYFGAFLATTAGNANVPAVLTYQANNIRGQWKRAFCSATLVGAGGVGGIIGTTVFREQDSPKYGPGVCISFGSGYGRLLTGT